MVNYTCSRCGYKTDRKSSYDNHLNRKKPCKLVEFEKSENSEKSAAQNCTFLHKKCAKMCKNVQTI